MIKEVKVLPYQRAFIGAQQQQVGLVAGYGTGKSWCATLATIIKKLQYPAQRICYYLPTYNDIRDIAFRKFPDMLNEMGLTYQLNRTAKELNITGYGIVMFRNMSEPDSIIGYEVANSVIDECDILSKHKMDDAFKHILARNREPLPDGKHNQVLVVGTPNGFRWFYERFVTKAHDNQVLIRAKTTDNPFLPESYIKSLQEDYDPKLLKQLIDGEFINVNGSAVYHQFSRSTHVVDDRAIDKHLPLIITFDFNINPYNAIFLVQKIDGIDYVVGNAIKKNASLIDSLSYLKEKYAHLGNYLYSATIYGDATGRARSQGTGRTNYQLIREAGFINQRLRKSNPRIVDRVNVFNSRLKNGRGDVRFKICESNKELITDLEQMAYNDKGIVDKSNQELSHASDSVGYYLSVNYGILENKGLRVNFAQ